MSTDRTLDRIDATLDDYDQWDGHSPDAARWDGDDWIDERATGWINAYQERVHAAALGGFPQRVIFGIDQASPHLVYLQAVDEAATSMPRAVGLEPTEFQRFWLNSWLLPSVPRSP